MPNLPSRLTSNPSGLISPDDFLIVELDDRLEFGAVVIDDGGFDTGCNGTTCSQNAYKC